jgi:hypothetical protein
MREVNVTFIHFHGRGVSLDSTSITVISSFYITNRIQSRHVDLLTLELF